MKFTKNQPWIISPCSDNTGGISTWTKNMYAYVEKLHPSNRYYIYHYENQMKSAINTNIIARIVTGLILYSKLSYNILAITIKCKPSVLHVTTSATLGLFKDIIIIWIAKLTKTPIVIHWHFGRIPELSNSKNWEWKLLKFVVRNSTYSIVIDNKSFNTLLEYGFLNVVNIPNPISLEIEQRANLQIEKNSKRSKGRILFVGHIIRSKGVFEIVEACVDIPEITELIIIGPYEEEIRNQLLDKAKKRNGGIWLKMLGQQNRNQVLEYMSISSILALPSYTEGFPNVVIEAMAMGCAIIATNVGAIPEMIDSISEKPCGFCVPVRDVKKLKESIIYLIKNSEEADEMGRRGIEKVLTNYTLDKIVKQYLDIWDVSSDIIK